MPTSLTELLKKAQGNLSKNEFPKRWAISSSTLTRLKENQKPRPALLKKIAAVNPDGPSYEELMAAAGYLRGNVPAEEVPAEFLVMARKTGGLSEEQRRRVYAMLDKTIDDVLALLEDESAK